MFKFMKAVFAAFYWSKSVSLAASEQYEKALENLNKSSKFRRTFDEEFFLLQGFLLGVTGNTEGAIISLKKAIDYSKSAKSRLNVDERIFLTNYAARVAGLLNVKEPAFENDDAYDIKKVAQHLQNKFGSRGN